MTPKTSARRKTSLPPKTTTSRLTVKQSLSAFAAVAAVVTGLQGGAAAQERTGAEADARTQALVEDLRRVIGDAQARDVARDDLLRTLQGLVDRYDQPYAHLIARDTFQDGNITTSPTWRILSGDWQAVAGSVVSPPTGPALVTPAQPPDDAEALREKLGAVTRMVERLRHGEQAAPPDGQQGAAMPVQEPARLALPVAIPDAFRIRLLVTLEDDPGDHEVAVVLREGEGERAQGYRLSIERLGSRSRLVLSRIGGIGSTTLASETLDDSLSGGQVRTLTLERTPQGRLRVLLDERVVIDSRDPRRPPDLDRLVLERGGGRLIVSLVEVRAPARGR